MIFVTDPRVHRSSFFVRQLYSFSRLIFRSAACEVICRHAFPAVLSPPSGGGRAAATVTSSLLLWILEGDQETCSEVLAERWKAFRSRVATLAGEVGQRGNSSLFAVRADENIALKVVFPISDVGVVRSVGPRHGSVGENRAQIARSSEVKLVLPSTLRVIILCIPDYPAQIL